MNYTENWVQSEEFTSFLFHCSPPFWESCQLSYSLRPFFHTYKKHDCRPEQARNIWLFIVGCNSMALLSCLFLTWYMQVGTATMYSQVVELSESVCICACLHMFVYVCASVFRCILLKIEASITNVAGCLHRCAAAFTCQLLVEVVSSLMTHGADSDGSACLLSLPHCLFLRPLSSLSQPG